MPDHAAIVVRRPAIDLAAEPPPDAPVEGALPRYWWGGDPFRTHFLNALSSTFPFGEAFFVRSVRHYTDRVDDPVLEAEIKGFAGQEGQHSRIHDQHVDLLVRQGYGAIETRNAFFDRLVRWHNRHTPAFALAVTASLEHLTAILARQVLSERAECLDDMHPEMRRLWRWHALEESEHKSVAFDVMDVVGVSHGLRVVAMLFSTFDLASETLQRMIYMFWKDGRLFDAGCWIRGWRFLFGRGGFLRGVGRAYRAWFRRGFHPDQIDDREMIASVAPLVAVEIAD